jgi:outer membrane protein assembly factor BamD (BamD/ComL family)
MQDADFENADQLIQEKKYNAAIAIYSRIAKEAPRSERGADALFAAATTRICFDNPGKDYQTALQEFDEFLRLYPKSDKAHDARNWRSVIKTVVDLRKENDNFRQNIEQLKKIDIKHEERRRK